MSTCGICGKNPFLIWYVFLGQSDIKGVNLYWMPCLFMLCNRYCVIFLSSEMHAFSQMGIQAGLSLRFYSPVALIFTPVANLLLCGWIVSTTGKFTHNIKGPSNILSRNRCYELRPLLTALSSGQPLFKENWYIFHMVPYLSRPYSKFWTPTFGILAQSLLRHACIQLICDLYKLIFWWKLYWFSTRCETTIV